MVFATLKLYVFLLTAVAYQCWGCHCPKGFKPFRRSCYHFSNGIETFGVADMMCHHMGGHLVRIESSAENAFIAAEVKHFPSEFAWIGLTDILCNNCWTWYDGMVPLSQTGYTNWGPNEPNNQGGMEHCGSMHREKGQWNDLECHRNERYVCERAARNCDL